MMSTLAELDPREAAEQLVAEQRDPSWLSTFAEELDRQLARGQLARVAALWQLSRTELGRVFGVSRQAATKWLGEGVPADRLQTVADLTAMTDLLVHHLKRDRIAAVVRRPAPSLGGASLLDLVADGRARDTLAATRQMFAFTDLHA